MSNGMELGKEYGVFKEQVELRLEKPWSDPFRKWFVFFSSGNRNKEKDQDWGEEDMCLCPLQSNLHLSIIFIQQMFIEWLSVMSII